MACCNTANLHRKISFPEDTGPHVFTDIEWWYYYAFLKGDCGGNYAAMAAFYRAGELPVLKGHYLIFSLIDLNEQASQSFSLIDRRLANNILYINLPLYLLQFPCDKNVWKLYGSLIQDDLPFPHHWLSHASIEKDPLKLSYGDSSMIFKNDRTGRFNVIAADEAMEASLEFKPAKPFSLIGGNGKPDKLYYYSSTRNEVNGCIKKGSSLEHVTGEGWFDHQWGYTGDLLSRTGWNWFGLQLDDGRELLINEFRSIQTGKTFSPMANLIEADGRLRFTRNLALHPLKFWQSPLTNAVYPLEWNICIPEFGMTVAVSADFSEQEMPVLGPLQAIWEGACHISGHETKAIDDSTSISGKGFLELVGYANYKC
ncbi:MAG TPA: lipocalin family protein [Ruminiclostridium sp.]|nr:lipocalin family protein [Ruminiclostridium sp.]